VTLVELLARDKPRLVLSKAAAASTDGHYNAYRRFDWPATLPDGPWLSEDLLTIDGTPFASEWSDEVKRRLGRCESVHFYSLNIHGERELIGEVIKRIHTPEWRGASEFFHHFIEEENAHIWFFAKFCLDYGGKIYPSRRGPLAKQEPSREIEQFLVLAKILIFEELVDHFNRRLAEDPSLPPLVRELNGVHHQEESRHIACSRELVAAAWELCRPSADARALEDYLRGYLQACLESLYNPVVYQDAEVPFNPYELRRALLAHPARAARHAQIMRRSQVFLARLGVFTLPEDTHDHP
jgi:hypothetical protein